MGAGAGWGAGRGGLALALAAAAAAVLGPAALRRSGAAARGVAAAGLAAVGLTCALAAWRARGRRRHAGRASGRRGPVRALAVLGSGGHTAEMLHVLKHLPAARYAPVTYVTASTDVSSDSKARALEAEREAGAGVGGGSGGAGASASFRTIPRSREVGQSFLTSVGTTLHASLFAFAVVWQERPELVLTNGPGTCIPICAAFWLLRAWGMCPNGPLIYVESIARVSRLSLSAKILYHSRIADELFVQWEGLQRRYPRSTFSGRLM